MILFFPFIEHETSVVSAEAESVTEGILEIPFLRLIEGEVDAVINLLVFILRIVIDGRRDDTVLECHDARHSLYSTGCTDQVACH